MLITYVAIGLNNVHPRHIKRPGIMFNLKSGSELVVLMLRFFIRCFYFLINSLFWKLVYAGIATVVAALGEELEYLTKFFWADFN